MVKGHNAYQTWLWAMANYVLLNKWIKNLGRDKDLYNFHYDGIASSKALFHCGPNKLTRTIVQHLDHVIWYVHSRTVHIKSDVTGTYGSWEAVFWRYWIFFLNGSQKAKMSSIRRCTDAPILTIQDQQDGRTKGLIWDLIIAPPNGNIMPLILSKLGMACTICVLQ